MAIFKTTLNKPVDLVCSTEFFCGYCFFFSFFIIHFFAKSAKNVQVVIHSKAMLSRCKTIKHLAMLCTDLLFVKGEQDITS